MPIRWVDELMILLELPKDSSNSSANLLRLSKYTWNHLEGSKIYHIIQENTMCVAKHRKDRVGTSDSRSRLPISQSSQVSAEVAPVVLLDVPTWHRRVFTKAVALRKEFLYRGDLEESSAKFSHPL